MAVEAQPLSNRQWLLLRLIVIAYLVIGALYAIYTPAWQVPDEPAHYNYIRALVTTGQFPVIELGDYDQAYLTRLVFDKKFSPDLAIEPLRYEDWQPPLYYLLTAPIFIVTKGALLALRLFSVLLGAGVVILAFLIVRAILPAQPSLALATAAFVAFVPQHVAMMAGVNNDSLAELLLAAVVWKASGRWKVEGVKWALVGILVGLGLVTKLSFYIAIPLVAWAIIRHYPLPLTRYSLPITHSPFAIRYALLVSLPALLIALPWWIRNLTVYGWPDFMGQLRHNAVVVGQPTSAWWIEQYGWGNLLERFFTFTFQSFWGQFGWLTTPMPARYYWVLGILSLIALGGCLWAVLPRLKSVLADVRFQLLGLWVVLNVLMYLYYNLTFVQHQGRYLFIALIPIGLAFSVGLRRWTLLLPRGGLGRDVALALPYLGLAALAVLALFRIIIPSL